NINTLQTSESNKTEITDNDIDISYSPSTAINVNNILKILKNNINKNIIEEDVNILCSSNTNNVSKKNKDSFDNTESKKHSEQKSKPKQTKKQKQTQTQIQTQTQTRQQTRKQTQMQQQQQQQQKNQTQHQN